MPPPALSAWIAELASVWPELSRPQIKMLAQYSLGTVLAEGSGLSRVAFCLSQWLAEPFARVRERLRDFYCDAQDKTGRRRRHLPVEQCFPGLLAWVLRDWDSDELPIALDATTLGQRFVVLVISVVYRGCAIPVAWKILPANAQGSWRPHWQRLLRQFRQVVPASMKVIVLADRGLYAKWLFTTIVSLGWHPFLRLNADHSDFKADDADEYVPLTRWLSAPGQTACQRGTLFRSVRARLTCTLTACWAQGCAEPWLIATDLPTDQVQATWYGLRAWIERGFKHSKSGGLRWQHTRMTDPQRADKLWLVMAIAQCLAIRCGNQYHLAPAPSAPQTPVPSRPPRNPLLTGKGQRPILSIFLTGLLLCRMMIQWGHCPPAAPMSPAPWPTRLSTHLSRSTSMPP